MVTFDEKLEHACRTFKVTKEEVGEKCNITPLAFHLHSTGQRELPHNEMALLCQFFNVLGNYFTNPDVRFFDQEKLPSDILELMKYKEDKPFIMCYQVAQSGAPDMTIEQLRDILIRAENEPKHSL